MNRHWAVELRATSAAVLVSVLMGACQREAAVDEATIDEGRIRNPTTTPTPQESPTTLQSGTTIRATPSAQALQDYLASAEPPGRRFPLPAIHFVGMSVREDPNGAVASITAILNQHPNARVRVEVGRPPTGHDQATADTDDLARQVAQHFVENGLAANRIEAAGIATQGPVEPATFLVVTAK